MIELFRYVQKSYPIPSPGSSIDLTGQSDFQGRLRALAASKAPPSRIRAIAEDLLNSNFPESTSQPVKLAPKLLAFAAAMRNAAAPFPNTLRQAAETMFGEPAAALIATPEFLDGKQLLNDVLISVKLATGFDRVDAAQLAAMRRVIAVLEGLGAGQTDIGTAEDVRRALQRPLRVPQAFLDALRPDGRRGPAQRRAKQAEAPSGETPASLLREQQELEAAYSRIMAMQPSEFVLTQPHAASARQRTRGDDLADPGLETRRPTETGTAEGTADKATEPALLTMPRLAIRKLGATVLRNLADDQIDAERAPVADVVASIKRRWQEVSRELAPQQVPAPVPVFRVGTQLFGLDSTPRVAALMDAPDLSEAFGKAITRPVGMGDLLVVRQELIGYEPGAVSHVENVLQHELMRRSTRRELETELTITQELTNTQSEERDQQSTSRNELATEAQKEASRQATAVQGTTTTTEYGRLVENSKTNYARSVTDRAVSAVSQTARQQRVQRESKRFTEEALHEFDNRDRDEKVRGVYQWLDQKFRTSVLNYGKRLLYDVVVPEPAAFLMSALKQAPQPENFRLTKPVEPSIGPSGLNPGNYMYYAARYGVTGAVTPPPAEFTLTVAKAEALEVSGTITAFGGTADRNFFGAFQIPIPDGHKAISGYIQRTNPRWIGALAANDRQFEFFIGERTFQVFTGPSALLNVSFRLNGEAGVLPVTLRSFNPIIQFNYAIGIHCQRTGEAYQQWQLKTHAAIMAGYQRQFADYLDRLGQYQAAVRAQTALADSLVRDDSVERDELKRAFIYLLLGEHFGQAYHPTPNPGALPPNPQEVREWGAMVAFFECAFEWENMIFNYHPYFWGRVAQWGELVLIQDLEPRFEAFLKAGAARIVVPVRPGFEKAMAHYHETGDIWMGEEMPDLFGDLYVSIIDEIKGRNARLEEEVCVDQWDVTLPTTLVILKDDAALPSWDPKIKPPPVPNS